MFRLLAFPAALDCTRIAGRPLPSLAKRIRLLMGIAVVLAIALCGISVKLLNDGAIAERRSQTTSQVEAAQGVLRHMEGLVTSGKLDVDAARVAAVRAIRTLQLTASVGEYIYLYDRRNDRLLLMPRMRTLEGQGVVDLANPLTGEFPADLMAMLRPHGAGINGAIDMRRPFAHGTREIFQTRIFAPWDWTIGAAVPVPSFWKDLVGRDGATLAAMVGLALAAIVGAVSIGHQLFCQLDRLSAQMRQIAVGGAVLAEEPPEDVTILSRASHSVDQVTERLAESDRRLAGIMESIADAVLVIDRDGLIEDSNHAASILFERAVIGQKLTALFDPIDQEQIGLLVGTDDPFGTGLRELEVGIWVGARRRDLSMVVSDVSFNQDHHSICILRDVTEQRRLTSELRRLATVDTLTGLPNRALIDASLGRTLERHPGRKTGRSEIGATLLFVDIDRFKSINDSLGFAAGDQLLRGVVERFSGVLPVAALFGRLGSDEFAILLEDTEAAAVTALIDDLLASLGEPIAVAGEALYVDVSIGYAQAPLHGKNAAELMRAADAALQMAKMAGGGRVHRYHIDANKSGHNRLTLERDLREAIGLGQLELHYQPKVTWPEQRLVGFEALLRWRHPTRGMVPPGSFIPVAEQTRLIEVIGDWVIDRACAQLRSWIDRGHAPVPVAINLSMKQLRMRSARDILDIVARHRIDPSLVEFEVTESALMHDLEEVLDTLHALSDAGATISLDDFGTGYSSLSQLKNLPISTIKIDRSFLADVPGDAAASDLAASIIAMAHRLDLDIVFEGVENAAQATFVEHHGVQAIQGFLISRAVPADRATALLRARHLGAVSD